MSLLERAGSTVVEYFEWDLPRVLNQGIAELLKYADNRRFSSEPGADEYTRILSHYMTSFLVLHHEKS